jgi:hypothetical protein
MKFWHTTWICHLYNNNKAKPKSSRVGKNIKYNYHEKITYLVASILLMGGGFANATEKTCLVRED